MTAPAPAPGYICAECGEPWPYPGAPAEGAECTGCTPHRTRTRFIEPEFRAASYNAGDWPAVWRGLINSHRLHVYTCTHISHRNKWEATTCANDAWRRLKNGEQLPPGWARVQGTGQVADNPPAVVATQDPTPGDVLNSAHATPPGAGSPQLVRFPRPGPDSVLSGGSLIAHLTDLLDRNGRCRDRQDPDAVQALVTYAYSTSRGDRSLLTRDLVTAYDLLAWLRREHAVTP